MAIDIAPEKVAHVIIKAREYDVKVGAWNDTPEEGDAEEDPNAILEDFANDPTRAELAGFIEALNDDEQANLVALAWVGRGTFEKEEFDEAVETARSERSQRDGALSARHAAARRLSRGGPREARLLRRRRRKRRALGAWGYCAPASQHLARVRLGRMHRIEHVHDAAVAHDEREPFQVRRRRRPRTSAGARPPASETAGVAQERERQRRAARTARAGARSSCVLSAEDLDARALELRRRWSRKPSVSGVEPCAPGMSSQPGGSGRPGTPGPRIDVDDRHARARAAG